MQLIQSACRKAAALGALALAIPFANADVVIDGVTYVQSGNCETVIAPFNTPDTMTTGMYSDMVMITVSGDGESLGQAQNDAFHIFEDGGGNPIAPYNSGSYYQLNAGIVALPPFILSELAVNKMVFDVDAGQQVAGGYVPAYRSDHTYSFVMNTGSMNLANMHFGVADGNFADNTGAYTITVCQLRPLPTVTCNGPLVLWSPNHNLVDGSSAFSVSTVDGTATTFTLRVFSDEEEAPETGDGTGKHAPDFKDARLDERGILLRSERKGNGNGRIYIGEITATNIYGSTTVRCGLAVVPHDASQASLDAVMAELAAGIAPFEHGLAPAKGPKQ